MIAKDKPQAGTWALSRTIPGHSEPLTVGFAVDGDQVEVGYYSGPDLVTSQEMTRDTARKLWFTLRNQGYELSSTRAALTHVRPRS